MSAPRVPRFASAGLLLVCSVLLSLLPTSCARQQDSQASAAKQLRIAVASNFSPTLRQLIPTFEAEQGVTVTIVTGSTGKLFAQIVNGAPYDLFLAADRLRPQQLEEAGLIVAGSRFTYAFGKLLLWSPKPDYFAADVIPSVPPDCRHFAIANPKHAPYGRAAEEALRALGMWDSVEDRLVRGENVGQAFQFVFSGNAEMGLVANSQVKQSGQVVAGSSWLVPQDLYAPIDQQAVMLRSSPSAQAFMEFLAGDHTRESMRGFGYGTP